MGAGLQGSLVQTDIKAVGHVDFSGVGGAGDAITINGVAYTEADTAVAASGIWTNGASAADSATSLAAAINGDLRPTKPPVTAVVSAGGDTVVVVANKPGPEYNYTITTTADNSTAYNMAGGAKGGRIECAAIAHTATAQDVLAGEVTIGLDWTPDAFFVQVFNAGVDLAFDGTTTLQSSPTRLRIVDGGSNNITEGMVVSVLAFRDQSGATVA